MSLLPNPKEFREHVERVAYRLENGMYDKVYDHSNSCVCVVGLALEDFRGEPMTQGEVCEFTAIHNSEEFRRMYGTFDMKDTNNPKEGAAKARKYLLETV